MTGLETAIFVAIALLLGLYDYNLSKLAKENKILRDKLNETIITTNQLIEVVQRIENDVYIYEEEVEEEELN